MKLVIWDTETTDKNGNAEVIQIAGIVTDINLKAQFAFNRYCYTNSSIALGAEAVHGLNKELLLKLSGGEFLEDVLDKIQINGNSILELPDMISITYNHNFDSRAVNNTLALQGLDTIKFGDKIETLKRGLTKGRYNLCAMQMLAKALNYGKVVKLEQLIRLKAKDSPAAIKQKYVEFCKLVNYDASAHVTHNALYDVFLVWYLLYSNKKMIYT
jgi:DNA polymerase III epsilon subunit-like protein